MMSGMHVWWWIFLIPVLVFIVWLIWPPDQRRREGVEDAEELVRRLYAAGEIDEFELRERLATLELEPR